MSEEGGGIYLEAGSPGFANGLDVEGKGKEINQVCGG